MKISISFIVFGFSLLNGCFVYAGDHVKAAEAVYQTVQSAQNVPSIEFEKAQIFQVHREKKATSSKMTIHNNGDKDLVITSFECEGFARTELHNSRFINGERVMYEIKVITVPAHGKTVISPNRTHFMMFDPLRDFEIGEYLKMKLESNLGTILVIAEIVPRRLK